MNSNLPIAYRSHEIDCGHRVVGQGGKCEHLHGHRYKITFGVTAVRMLDEVGRVLDFSVMKSVLCQWLEDNWDHKTLIWNEDPDMIRINSVMEGREGGLLLRRSIVWVPFNPTAENMASYLLGNGNYLLKDYTEVELVSVRVEETSKCYTEVVR